MKLVILKSVAAEEMKDQLTDEVKGEQEYRQAAKKSKSKKLKRMYDGMADDEHVHAENIRGAMADQGIGKSIADAIRGVFSKSYHKPHSRKLKSGEVVHVDGYYDKRSKKVEEKKSPAPEKHVNNEVAQYGYRQNKAGEFRVYNKFGKPVKYCKSEEEAQDHIRELMGRSRYNPDDDIKILVKNNDPLSAINKMIKLKRGVIPNLSSPVVKGNIELFWGDSDIPLLGGQKHINGCGAIHIIEGHGATALRGIVNVLKNGERADELTRDDKIAIEFRDSILVIRKDFNGKEKQWIVTSYERKIKNSEPGSPLNARSSMEVPSNEGGETTTSPRVEPVDSSNNDYTTNSEKVKHVGNILDELKNGKKVFRGTAEGSDYSGTGGDWHGTGIYFSDSKVDAGLYGIPKEHTIQMKNPFVIDENKSIVEMLAESPVFKNNVFRENPKYTFKTLNNLINKVYNGIDINKIEVFDGGKEHFKNVYYKYKGKDFYLYNKAESEYSDLKYLKELLSHQILHKEYEISNLPVRMKDAINPAVFSNTLEKNGYDGIVAPGSNLPGTKEYIVFDKSQIEKSYHNPHYRHLKSGKIVHVNGYHDKRNKKLVVKPVNIKMDTGITQKTQNETVYRGTSKDTEKRFDGEHYSADYNFANKFGDVTEYNLGKKNILDITDRNTISKLFGEDTANDFDSGDFWKLKPSKDGFNGRSIDAVIKYAKAQGYDGIKYIENYSKDTKPTNYLMFDELKSKSDTKPPAVKAVKLPGRNKQYGVGKDVYGSVYIHKDYMEKTFEVDDKLAGKYFRALRELPAGAYDKIAIVSYDTKDDSFTFSESPDFDTNPEPVIRKQYKVTNGTVKEIANAGDNPQIYHHKWQMVKDDYPGFDIEQSIARSKEWKALDNVDLHRIGRLKFWNETVVPRLSVSEGFSEEQTDAANRTSRSGGAVGNAYTLTSRYISETGKPGEKILDFGAGKDAVQTLKLRNEGLDVTAYDFGKNLKPGLHDAKALSRQYDTVYASNVLNVQQDAAMCAKTLKQITNSVKPGGRLVANYPVSPRYCPYKPSELKAALEGKFESVERVGGTSSAPLFECKNPIKSISKSIRDAISGAFAFISKSNPHVDDQPRAKDGKWVKDTGVIGHRPGFDQWRAQCLRDMDVTDMSLAEFWSKTKATSPLRKEIARKRYLELMYDAVRAEKLKPMDAIKRGAYPPKVAMIMREVFSDRKMKREQLIDAVLSGKMNPGTAIKQGLSYKVVNAMLPHILSHGKVNMAKSLIMRLLKSYHKPTMRRLPNGQMVRVEGYYDKRTKKPEDTHTLDMFAQKDEEEQKHSAVKPVVQESKPEQKAEDKKPSSRPERKIDESAPVDLTHLETYAKEYKSAEDFASKIFDQIYNDGEVDVKAFKAYDYITSQAGDEKKNLMAFYDDAELSEAKGKDAVKTPVKTESAVKEEAPAKSKFVDSYNAPEAPRPEDVYPDFGKLEDYINPDNEVERAAYNIGYLRGKNGHIGNAPGNDDALEQLLDENNGTSQTNAMDAWRIGYKVGEWQRKDDSKKKAESEPEEKKPVDELNPESFIGKEFLYNATFQTFRNGKIANVNKTDKIKITGTKERDGRVYLYYDIVGGGGNGYMSFDSFKKDVLNRSDESIEAVAKRNIAKNQDQGQNDTQADTGKKPLDPKNPYHHDLDTAITMIRQNEFNRYKKGLDQANKILADFNAIEPKFKAMPRGQYKLNDEQLQIRSDYYKAKENLAWAKQYAGYWGGTFSDSGKPRLDEKTYMDITPQMRSNYTVSYIKEVKDQISKGYDIPQSMINKFPEFTKAVDARARYEKGHHTSFANKSAAVNYTTKKDYGFKVKRQDGKEMTDKQIQSITIAAHEFEKAVGPIKDLLDHLDLTIAHTSGKFPFLRNDASGLYSGSEKTITVGMQGIKAFAHELAHAIDHSSNTMSRHGGKYGRQLAEGSYAVDGIDVASMGKKLMNGSQHEIDRAMKAGKTLTPEQLHNAAELKSRIGKYYDKSEEVFARLVEQYVSTKVGGKLLGAENFSELAEDPTFYDDGLGYWTKENFAELMPHVEKIINKKIELARSARNLTKPESFGGIHEIEEAHPGTLDLISKIKKAFEDGLLRKAS